MVEEAGRHDQGVVGRPHSASRRPIADDRLYDIWWDARTAEQKAALLRKAEDVALTQRAAVAKKAGRVNPWMSPEERAKLQNARSTRAP